MPSAKSDSSNSVVPTSDEFSKTMGHIVWLMTLSKEHKDKPISLVESLVSAPLMFKQVRVFTKGKQPLAAVIWAYASAEIKARVSGGNYTMKLQDWRSGSEVVVVDCISPFLEKQMFIDQFLTSVKDAKDKAIK